MIYLVGAATDPLIEGLAARLADHAVVIDTLSFPASVRVSATAALSGIALDGRALQCPDAVYVRSYCAQPHDLHTDVAPAMTEDWSSTTTALAEKDALLRGVVARWEALGARMYNPPSSSWRLVKPVQLALLADAGLPVPDTLWTNDPAAVRRFSEGRRIAYKPVRGGAATQELTPDDLTDERLEMLAAAPVTFQELLPGEDIRVYVLDRTVAAAYRIRSRKLDFRGHEDAIETCELTPALATQCLRAASVLGLRWTGIDVKLDGAGSPRFLEANSSPMFLGFDDATATDLLGQLANALLGDGRGSVRVSPSTD